VASLHIARARLCHERGRLDEALVHARRAGELADLVPMLSGFVDVGLLAILYESAAEAEVVHRRVEKIADTGEFGALVVGWSVQARRLLDAGAIAPACDLFARVEELAERLHLRNPSIWYWARYAAVAYASDGRVDDARRVISLLERSSAGGLPCRWPRIAAHAGRAALAEATGDLDEADRRHRAALAVHEEVEVPLEHVETLLAYGAFLRRRGLPARARPFLADALARARHLGARRLTAAARDELSAAGGRRRQGRSEELTGQELRVARLAATGLANREIAAALSITVRTVEYHLGHAYAKLGLRSRRDLIVRADRLEAAPAEQ
jgi:DNA-binding CsgD family transcriptional regulator